MMTKLLLKLWVTPETMARLDAVVKATPRGSRASRASVGEVALDDWLCERTSPPGREIVPMNTEGRRVVAEMNGEREGATDAQKLDARREAMGLTYGELAQRIGVRLARHAKMMCHDEAPLNEKARAMIGASG